MTEENNTTAMEVGNKQNVALTSFEEINGMARAFVASGMFSDTKQLSQAIVKIQAGKELGLQPVYSMQNINLIRNRLCSSANTLAMLVKGSGRYNYKIIAHDDKQCSINFYENQDGKMSEVGNSTFTMDDAKRAELVKPDSGWVKYPRAMLFSRAISQGARIYCPDAIGGMYTDEEMRAIPTNPETSIQSVKKVTANIVGDKKPVQEDDFEPVEEQAEEETLPTYIKTIEEKRDALIKGKITKWNNRNFLYALNTMTKNNCTSISEALAGVTPEQATIIIEKLDGDIRLL